MSRNRREKRKCIRKRNRPDRLYERYLKSFLPIIVASLIIIGGILITFQLRSLFRERRIGESNRNAQIVNNVSDYTAELELLATYPYMDNEVLKILRKDYSGENTMFERVQDDAAVKNKLATNLYHMRSDLNSILLISNKTGMIYSAYHGSLMPNAEYKNTAWYNKILNSDRNTVYLGLYFNELTPHYQTLFGLGNSIIDPQTGEILGVVILNVEERSFRRSWETEEKPDSSTILYDRFGNRYDSLSETDRPRLDAILAKIDGENEPYRYFRLDGTSYCLIRNTSGATGWISYRIVNMSREWRQVWFFLAMLLAGTLLLYLVLREFCKRMALRVTRPLEELSLAMEQTAEGNFDIRAQEGDDEVGTLARKFNSMSDHISRLIDRVRSEEREKGNAELLALQSQINPHFLFNTIQSIKTMADLQGAARIAGVLEQLMIFLRGSYGLVDEQVTVQQECTQARSYLELMNYRYMGRFHYSFDIDSDAEECLVPRFILQPIIENAILHGIDLNSTSGEIGITGRRDGKRLLLTVRDNGRGMSEDTIEKMLSAETTRQSALNVGVSNVIKRIHLLCGEEYGLSVQSREGEFTCVTITLPVKNAEK